MKILLKRIIPVAIFLFFLETIFVNSVDWSTARIPAGYPTTLASITRVGSVLLVPDNAPPIYRPSHYEYIMPEEQQQRILKEAPLLKLGQTVDSVIEKLGPPLDDDLGWGPKAVIYFFVPSTGVRKPWRSLKYHFAKRTLNLVNAFDPHLELFFDRDGKLTWLYSDINPILQIGGPNYTH